jgi:hypothetical protein
MSKAKEELGKLESEIQAKARVEAQKRVNALIDALDCDLQKEGAIHNGNNEPDWGVPFTYRRETKKGIVVQKGTMTVRQMIAGLREYASEYLTQKIAADLAREIVSKHDVEHLG